MEVLENPLSSNSFQFSGWKSNTEVFCMPISLLGSHQYVQVSKGLSGWCRGVERLQPTIYLLMCDVNIEAFEPYRE